MRLQLNAHDVIRTGQPLLLSLLVARGYAFIQSARQRRRRYLTCRETSPSG